MQKNNYSNIYKDINSKITPLIYEYRENKSESTITEIIIKCEPIIHDVYKNINYKSYNRLFSLSEDLFQEGRMAVIDAVMTFDKKYEIPPSTHIFNTCFKYMQRMHRKYLPSKLKIINNDKNQSEALLKLIPHDTYDIIDDMIIESDISTMLECLSPIEQSIIIYKYWWNLSPQDISIILNISSRTIYRKTNKIEKKLFEKNKHLRSDYFGRAWLQYRNIFR